MADLLYPMVDIRLYNKGAEGYCSDVGQTVYDIIASNYENAYFSATTGHPKPDTSALSVIAQKFLCCTPQFYPVDTVLTDFTLDPAAYFVEPENSIYLNTKMLRMNNAGEPETPVSATAITNWYYPEGMSIAFQLQVEPPARAKRKSLDGEEYTEETANIWITFGNDEWGLKIVGTTATLYRWTMRELVGEWQKVGEYHPPESKTKIGGKESDALDIVFLNLRDELWILTDHNAETGDVYQRYAGGSVTFASGPLKLQFNGCMGNLGLYEIFMEEGTYESPLIPLFEDRTAQAPTKRLEQNFHFTQPHFFDDDYDTLYQYCDVLQLTTWPGSGDHFAYKATLTPKVLPPGAGNSGFDAPFSFYDTPCLMAVEFDYPAVIVAPTPSGHVHLTDYGVLKVNVELPEELDAGTATVQMMLDPRVTFSGEYRRRYMEIEIGHCYDDGTYDLWPTFAGYVTAAKTKGEEGWRYGHTCDLQMLDASYVGKQQTGGTVDESWPPLDGWTPNAALAYCAGKIGIHSSRCDWAVDTVDLGPDVQQLYLSVGPAENPIWWRTGEVKLDMAVWDVMVLIASTLGYELFVSPEGVWTTRLRDYYTGTTYAFDAAGSYPLSAMSLEYEAAALTTGTAVMANGEDDKGKMVAAWYINFDKERTPATDLFAGRRLWRRISGQRFNTVEDCIASAAQEFDKQNELSYYLYWTSPLAPQVLRNDKGTISNAEGDGVSPAAVHLIGAISHQIAPYYEDTNTAFKARRLP